jgi:hypothetical protein
MNRDQELISHIEKCRVEEAQAVTGAENLMESMRHSDAMFRLMKDGARHDFPNASEQELLQIIRDRLDLIRSS